MKKIFYIFSLSLFVSTANAQKSITDETSLQTVTRIYQAFIKQVSNAEIAENRQAMRNALLDLYQTADKKDYGLLIAVWLDYDPPNFPTKKLIEPILFKDKVAVIEKINELLGSATTWHSKNTAPGADLEKLRELVYKKGEIKADQ